MASNRRDMLGSMYRRTVSASQVFGFALQTFKTSKVRSLLTALGVMIGTASLILVVTIGLTGKQYILRQIQSVGANMIQAYYAGDGDQRRGNDFLTLDDVRAVREQVPGVIYASPMLMVHAQVGIGRGRQRGVVMLGVSTDYQRIRNLEVLAGRFFDDDDRAARNKVALIEQKLAARLYGGQDAAIGQQLTLAQLQFTIVGTFRERVETFGQTEISDDSIVIPDTVARYFSSTDKVKNAFFAVASASQVPAATAEIKRVLQSRHRPGAVYQVENLTELLAVAAKTANALTLVLLLISTVTLVVSGVGIMNIMLATVNARIREIGVRKAVGATRREILHQFLTEAALISVVGGVAGTLVGLSIPLSLRWIAGFHIPISGWSVVIALAVASTVGLVFGTAPARRAASLDPVVSLHYE